jgi:hypothetical protein
MIPGNYLDETHYEYTSAHKPMNFISPKGKERMYFGTVNILK